MPSKKSPKPPTEQRLFAVAGSDEGQMKRRAKALATQLTPSGAGEFGVEVIDGCVDNADQAVRRVADVLQAIQTLPFFGSEKLVWLKDVNFLADTVSGRAPSTLKALDELREFLENGGVPPGVKLLVSAAEADKRRSFYKALAKLTRLEVYDKVDTSKAGWEEDAQSLAMQLAGQLGLRFQPEALELFVLRAGADSRQIQNELSKLDLYLGADRREIKVGLVRDLVSKSATGVIWELSNSILKRDLAGSLQLLDQLLFQGETAVTILLAAIVPTIRNLMAVKALFEQYNVSPPQVAFHFSRLLGRLPPEATEHLPRKKDGGINAYGLGLAACEAHRFSLTEAVNAVDACLQANLQLVSSQLEPRLVLSQLLVKMLEENATSGKMPRMPQIKE